MQGDMLAQLRMQLDEQLRLVAESGRKAPPEIVAKLGELAALAYEESSVDEREAVSLRIQEACGVTLQEQMGEVTAVAHEDTADYFLPMIPDGFLRRYIEYTAESEAPTQFHFGAALTCAAAALRRRPLIGWGAIETYPNLYTLLVGPTGARKSTAIRLATSIMREGAGINVLPPEGTHQGYAAALRKRWNETQIASDGLIVASEYSVMVSADKHKADLPKWLTDWYDSPPHWERALRAEEHYELDNVYVCVLAASNVAWLRSFPPDAVTGGFLPRHIIFGAGGRRHRLSNPKYPHTLKKELVDSLLNFVTTVPDDMSFAPDAERYLDEWYMKDLAAQEDSTHDEQMLAWLARKQAAAIKIAVIWQLLDNGRKDCIELKYMQQARDIVDYGDRTVAEVYTALGVTREAEAADEVMHYLKRRSGVARHSEIVRALRNRFRAAKVRDALATLEAGRMVRRENDGGVGVVWRIVR